MAFTKTRSHVVLLLQVLPLVFIMTTAVVGCTSFMLYCSQTRTDVR